MTISARDRHTDSPPESAGDTEEISVARHILDSPELWKIAEHCIRCTYSRTAAAREFIQIMAKGFDEPCTPAGERYTQKAVKAAMRTSKATPAEELMPRRSPTQEQQ